MLQNLTPKKRAAAKSLAAGISITQTAVSVGASRETIYRWLDLPDFLAAVDAATDDQVESLARRLVGLCNQALDALEEILTDPNAPPGVKLRAADLALAKMPTLREQAEFDRRLSELEDQAVNHG